MIRATLIVNCFYFFLFVCAESFFFKCTFDSPYCPTFFPHCQLLDCQHSQNDLTFGLFSPLPQNAIFTVEELILIYSGVFTASNVNAVWDILAKPAMLSFLESTNIKIVFPKFYCRNLLFKTLLGRFASFRLPVSTALFFMFLMYVSWIFLRVIVFVHRNINDLLKVGCAVPSLPFTWKYVLSLYWLFTYLSSVIPLAECTHENVFNNCLQL